MKQRKPKTLEQFTAEQMARSAIYKIIFGENNTCKTLKPTCNGQTK